MVCTLFSTPLLFKPLAHSITLSGFVEYAALYLYVNRTLPATSELMSKVYEDHKKEDGFLYMTYNGESTFGALCEEEDDM